MATDTSSYSSVGTTTNSTTDTSTTVSTGTSTAVATKAVNDDADFLSASVTDGRVECEIGTVPALSAFVAVPTALAGWLWLELRRRG